ncbi:fimbrillin family protein [Bacteroides bouchesdurhonensis]
MKKVLLATAVAAMAFTSCSQNEEFEAQNQKEQIGFSSVVGKSIRAAEADKTALESNGFQLYAYNTGLTKIDAVQDAGLTEFFKGPVSHTTGSWELSSTYYWPIGENIQFFGYSPANTASTTSWNATKASPSFEYTIKDVNAQEDLLAAAVYDKCKTTNTTMGNVNLLFNHILTQINFAVKGKDSGFKYNVASITLKDVPNKGIYTFASASKENVNEWANGAWEIIDASSNKADYVYGATYGEITDTGSSALEGANLGLMLLPNSDVSAIKVEVVYSVTVSGKKVFDGTKEVALKGAWGVGKKILYTLTLPSGAEEFTFTADTSTWGTPENGEVTE